MFGNLNRYEGSTDAHMPVQKMMPSTLKEQLENQMNYHLMKAAEIKAVIDQMTPEISNFMEAWYKINR